MKKIDRMFSDQLSPNAYCRSDWLKVNILISVNMLPKNIKSVMSLEVLDMD